MEWSQFKPTSVKEIRTGKNTFPMNSPIKNVFKKKIMTGKPFLPNFNSIFVNK